MTATLSAILPIFLTIAIGYGLRKGGIPSTEFWNLNDKLVYWVLMPCLLFNKISLAPLGAAALGPYSVTILGGFLVALVFGWAVARAAGLAPAQGTCVLQGSSRHNSFIGLALAANLFGPVGFDIAILATAMLVPVSNILVVTCVVSSLQGAVARNLPLAILRELARNPYVVTILAALVANQTIGHEIPVLHDVTALLGAGALPITLLAVGANLRVRRMQAAFLPLLLAFAGKMVVFPLAVLAIGLALNLTPEIFQVALIYAVVPTSVASYTLANQLGADAPLMAAIVTLQTLLALVTIPISLGLLLPLIA